MSKEEFKILFDLHFDPIRRYLYYRCGDSELASDTAQDLFARVWERGMALDPLKDRALLYKIASDMIVSRFRRKKTEQKFINSIKLVNNESDPLVESEYSDLKKRYAKALIKMGEKRRSAFLLSREEELKYEEISERLGISVKAVEKRISGALDILKKGLIN